MHLHVGLHPVNFNRFFRQLGSLGLKYTVDGDGWNVWGEGVGVNGNDEWTVHVIVIVKDAEQANEVLALGPLMTQHKEGFNALLTDDDNWTVVYQTFPDLIPGLVPNDVLTHLVTLRDYAISLGEGQWGEDAQNIISQSEEAYDCLLIQLKDIYAELQKCNRQHA